MTTPPRVFTAILALSAVVILACAQDPAPSPTPAPTTSLEPTAATPTATPQPTAAPAATPTASPQPTAKATASAALATEDTRQTTDSGVITTLSRDDQEAFLSAISGVERDCLIRSLDAQRLMVLTGTLEFASPGEVKDVIRCLGNETIVRILVTESISDIGRLSEGSSACIRDGLSAIDLRSSFAHRLADYEAWFEDEGFMGSTTALLISNSCLNEEEFQDVTSPLDITVEDRAAMQCMLKEVGGPEVLASLEWQAGHVNSVLLDVMLQCEVRGLHPSLLSEVQDVTFTTFLITPIVPEGPASQVAAFSVAERDCVAELAGTDDLLEVLASLGQKDAAQMYGCMSDETMMNIFLGLMLGKVGTLSEESSACIRSGVTGKDLRSVMQAEGEIYDHPLTVFVALHIVAIACLNDEEWQAVLPSQGYDPGDRQRMQCMMDALGGPQGTAFKLGSGDFGALASLQIASPDCDFELSSPDDPGVSPEPRP